VKLAEQENKRRAKKAARQKPPMDDEVCLQGLISVIVALMKVPFGRLKGLGLMSMHFISDYAATSMLPSPASYRA